MDFGLSNKKSREGSLRPGFRKEVLKMFELGKIEGIPRDAKSPFSLCYKSVDWMSQNMGLVFYSTSFGNPLLEEKPTRTIISNIEETMANLQFAAELMAWEIASDEALAAFESKLLEQ